jgi:hypothetical protein
MEAEKATSQQFMLQMTQKQTEQVVAQQAIATQQLVSQYQAMDQFKGKFFTEMLHAKKDETGGLDGLLKLKNALDMLRGDVSNDGREKWERVVDKLGEVGPGLLAAASASLGRPIGVPPGQPAQTPQAGAPARQGPQYMVAPLPPEPGQLPAPRHRHAKRAMTPEINTPYTPNPVAQVHQQSNVIAQAPAPVPEEPVMPTPQNAPQMFAFPDLKTPTEEAIKMLVADVNYALMQDYASQRIYDEVLKKFPPKVLLLLTLVDAEKCIEIVGQNAPSDWMINSLKGNQAITELRAMIAESV